MSQIKKSQDKITKYFKKNQEKRYKTWKLRKCMADIQDAKVEILYRCKVIDKV